MLLEENDLVGNSTRIIVLNNQYFIDRDWFGHITRYYSKNTEINLFTTPAIMPLQSL